MTALTLVGLLWATQSLPLHAQSNETSNSTRSLLLRGKTTLDHGVNAGSIDSLRKARALFKHATNGNNHQALAHYYVALADYRVNTQYDSEKEREPLLKDAIDHLKTATNLAPENADAWALLSACYGQRLSLDPLRGMTLGPKADEALAKAKELAPENPRVWIVSGTSDYFTPSMFGGDKERALEQFKKAARLAEKETVEDPLQPSWGHAEAYAWIGHAHMNAERYDEARASFEKALSINPKYGWVRHVLLPRLDKKTE